MDRAGRGRFGRLCAVGAARVAGAAALVLVPLGTSQATASWTPESTVPPPRAEAVGAWFDRDGTANLLYFDVRADPGDIESPAPYEPPVLMLARRSPGGEWTDTPAKEPAFPDAPLDMRVITGAGGTTAIARGASGRRYAAFLVADGRWSRPVPIAGLPAAVEPAVAAGERTAVVAWRDGDLIRAAIGRPTGFEPPIAVGRAAASAPAVAMNRTGDAVVAYDAAVDGRRVVRAADRPLHRRWRTRTVAPPPGRPALAGVLLDATGTATAVWTRRRGLGTVLRASRHGLLARAWSRPERITDADVQPFAFTSHDAAGTVSAYWTRADGRIRAAARNGRPGWRAFHAVPSRVRLLQDAIQSPFGDRLLKVVGDFSLVRISTGERPRFGPIASVDFLALRPAVSAAGDAIVVWPGSGSNSTRPLVRAAYDAPAPPDVTGLTLVRRGDARSLRLDLSRAGRVLISLSRLGSPRPSAVARVGVRARRASVPLPPAIRRALRPGRHLLTVESAGRDPARARRSILVAIQETDSKEDR